MVHCGANQTLNLIQDVTQPRSQGLSSSRQLERGLRRGPSNEAGCDISEELAVTNQFYSVTLSIPLCAKQVRTCKTSLQEMIDRMSAKAIHFYNLFIAFTS